MDENTKGTKDESNDKRESYTTSLNSKSRLHHAPIWREEERLRLEEEEGRCIETSRHEGTYIAHKLYVIKTFNHRTLTILYFILQTYISLYLKL